MQGVPFSCKLNIQPEDHSESFTFMAESSTFEEENKTIPPVVLNSFRFQYKWTQHKPLTAAPCDEKGTELMGN